MRRNSVVIGIILFVFCFSFMITAGCAKKAVSKDEGLTAGEQKAAAQAAPEVKKQETAPVAVAPVKPEESRELALRQDAAAAAAAEKMEKVEFEDIRFAFDKATIEPDARVVLKKLADWLMKNKDYIVSINGNCDERGTVEYNLALGQRRADAAMKYLVDLGVDRARIATISYGKERPLDAGHSEEAWAKNRRDGFTVTAKK